MNKGRVIGVVGPSGVGKDSVITGLTNALPDLTRAIRVITREPGPDELHEAVDEVEFARRVEQGAFCLHWSAHGLSYGIPDRVRQRVDGGESFLVNLSRSVLTQAQAVFPNIVVISLTAHPDTLSKRLAGRGRETKNAISARLDRAGVAIPPQVNSITISNDGSLDETIADIVSALALERV